LRPLLGAATQNRAARNVKSQSGIGVLD